MEIASTGADSLATCRDLAARLGRSENAIRLKLQQAERRQKRVRRAPVSVEAGNTLVQKSDGHDEHAGPSVGSDHHSGGKGSDAEGSGDAGGEAASTEHTELAGGLDNSSSDASESRVSSSERGLLRPVTVEDLRRMSTHSALRDAVMTEAPNHSPEH
jgi:hypothetical protein